MADSKKVEFKMAANIKMSQNEWVKFFFVQNGWIQDGRIQDAWHHQVEGEWMSLSPIELVWIRVRVEWECFWVNLREDNKVSESKMAVSESNMAESKMVAIIKLSQNEWEKFFFKMADSKKVEFKMAAIIKMSQNEWVKFFFVQNGWIQYGRIQDASYHQVEWEGMSEVFFLFKMAESKMAQFNMAAIMKLSENEWVWVRLN